MGLLDGLEVYFEQEETSGTRFDSTTNNYDLAENIATGNRPGIIGICADFRTGGNLVSRASAPLVNFGDEDFTIQAWLTVEPATEFTVQGYIGKWVAAGNQRAYMLRYNSGPQKFDFVVSLNGANSVQVQSSAIPPFDGTFQHVICIHDSVADQITMQVNLGTITTANPSGGIFSGSTAPFELGRSSTAFGLSLCDEVGIWRRKLSASEITSLFNGGSGLPFSSFTSGVAVGTDPAEYNYFWKRKRAYR